MLALAEAAEPEAEALEVLLVEEEELPEEVEAGAAGRRKGRK